MLCCHQGVGRVMCPSWGPRLGRVCLGESEKGASDSFRGLGAIRSESWAWPEALCPLTRRTEAAEEPETCVISPPCSGLPCSPTFLGSWEAQGLSDTVGWEDRSPLDLGSVLPIPVHVQPGKECLSGPGWGCLPCSERRYHPHPWGRSRGQAPWTSLGGGVFIYMF